MAFAQQAGFGAPPQLMRLALSRASINYKEEAQ